MDIEDEAVNGAWIEARQGDIDHTLPELEGRPEPRPNVRTTWTRRGSTMIGTTGSTEKNRDGSG